MPLTHSFEERILIHAPTGKDGALLAQSLERQGLKTQVCGGLAEVAGAVLKGVGAIVLAEEALTGPEVIVLQSALHAQPSWSDVPILILTSGGEEEQASLRALHMFGPGGNVTLLERPLQAVTLSSALQVALRSRRRQYEVRELLASQKADHDALKKVSSDLARSNMNLEHFASIASHDLQEPLRKIRSFADRLKAKLEFLGETERDYFMRIESAAGRMSHLIERWDPLESTCRHASLSIL